MPDYEFFATKEQIEAIECCARYILVAAGRRFGKTKGIIQPRLCKRAIEQPGWKGAYIGPNYLLAEEQFEEIAEVCRADVRRVRRRPPFRISFYNRSELVFFSWERPKNIRGFGYNEVDFDEIQEARDPVQFWAVIRPLLSDRRGTLLVSGQFRGHNWYYNEFVGRPRAHPEKYPRHRYFIFPARLGIMYRGAAGRQELEDAKAQLPAAVYDQEYECIPAANQAAVLRPEDITACTRGTPPATPQNGKFYIIGHDIGMFRDHPATCVTQVERVAHGTYGKPLVVHQERGPLLVKHEIQAKRLADLARRWNAQVIIDATAGGAGGKKPAEEILKYYRKLLPDARFLVVDHGFKGAMVVEGSQLFEQHEVSVPACFGGLIEELGLFEYVYRHGGYYYGREGVPDDQVFSLLLTLHGMRAGFVKPSQGPSLSSLTF